MFGLSRHAFDSLRISKITQQVLDLKKYIYFFTYKSSGVSGMDVMHDIILYLHNAPNVDPDDDLSFFIKKLARTMTIQAEGDIPVEFLEYSSDLAFEDTDNLIRGDLMGDIVEELKELYLCNTKEYVLLQEALDCGEEIKVHFLDGVFVERFKILLKKYTCKDICTCMSYLDGHRLLEAEEGMFEVTKDLVRDYVNDAKSYELVVPYDLTSVGVDFKSKMIYKGSKYYDMCEDYYTDLDLEEVDWSLGEFSSKLIVRINLESFYNYIYEQVNEVSVDICREFLGSKRWVGLDGRSLYDLGVNEFVDICRRDLAKVLGIRFKSLIGGTENYFYYQLNRSNILNSYSEVGKVVLVVPAWSGVKIDMLIEEVENKEVVAF